MFIFHKIARKSKNVRVFERSLISKVFAYQKKNHVSRITCYFENDCVFQKIVWIILKQYNADAQRHAHTLIPMKAHTHLPLEVLQILSPQYLEIDEVSTGTFGVDENVSSHWMNIVKKPEIIQKNATVPTLGLESW